MCRISLLSLLLLITASAAAGTYTTSFSGTENPISESSVWNNGLAVGLSWANVRKTPALAFGTQTGNEANDNDSTAILNNTSSAGTWAADQSATATIFRSGTQTANAEECELRLRSTITASSCTGYEIIFGTNGLAANSPYIQFVKWNGALDSFTLIDSRAVPTPNGTVCKAAIVGTTITAYTNGVEAYHVTDSTYSSGNPGMGFYLKLNGGAGNNSDFGWTQWSATDGQANPSTTFTNTLRNCVLKNCIP